MNSCKQLKEMLHKRGDAEVRFLCDTEFLTGKSRKLVETVFAETQIKIYDMGKGRQKESTEGWAVAARKQKRNHQLCALIIQVKGKKCEELLTEVKGKFKPKEVRNYIRDLKKPEMATS